MSHTKTPLKRSTVSKVAAYRQKRLCRFPGIEGQEEDLT
jgi:hypothetical protein